MVKKDAATRAASVLLSHPYRGEIVELLAAHGKLSPTQTRDLMSGSRPSLSSLSYHFRELADAKVIRSAGHVARRGAVEHFWVLSPRAVDMIDAVTARLRDLRQLMLPTTG